MPVGKMPIKWYYWGKRYTHLKSPIDTISLQFRKAIKIKFPIINIAIFSISLLQFDVINVYFLFLFSLHSHIIIEIENIIISIDILYLYVFSRYLFTSLVHFSIFLFICRSSLHWRLIIFLHILWTLPSTPLWFFTLNWR